jgi:hypothetical protein
MSTRSCSSPLLCRARWSVSCGTSCVEVPSVMAALAGAAPLDEQRYLDMMEWCVGSAEAVELGSCTDVIPCAPVTGAVTLTVSFSVEMVVLEEDEQRLCHGSVVVVVAALDGVELRNLRGDAEEDLSRCAGDAERGVLWRTQRRVVFEPAGCRVERVTLVFDVQRHAYLFSGSVRWVVGISYTAAGGGKGHFVSVVDIQQRCDAHPA